MIMIMVAMIVIMMPMAVAGRAGGGGVGGGPARRAGALPMGVAVWARRRGIALAPAALLLGARVGGSTRQRARVRGLAAGRRVPQGRRPPRPPDPHLARGGPSPLNPAGARPTKPHKTHPT